MEFRRVLFRSCGYAVADLIEDAEVVLRRRVAPLGAAAVSLEGGGVVAGGEGLVGRRERRRAQQEALHEVQHALAAEARRKCIRLAAGQEGIGVGALWGRVVHYASLTRVSLNDK